MIAFPAAVSLTIGDNATCQFGNCSNVDVLAAGQTVSDLVHVQFTVNGDTFSLYAPFLVANHDPNKTVADYSPSVTYEGSAPTTQDDIFEISFWQNYSFSGTLNGKTYGSATGAIIQNAGLGSNFTAQAWYGGQGVGVLGPFTEGASSDSKQTTLTGLSGDPLTFQYQMIYDFTAGSNPFAVMAAPGAAEIPEPGPLALLGSGLLLFSGIRRLSKSSGR